MGVSRKTSVLVAPPERVLLESSGMLLKASRCLGTVREMLKMALRAGSSQQGNARLVEFDFNGMSGYTNDE